MDFTIHSSVSIKKRKHVGIAVNTYIHLENIDNIESFDPGTQHGFPFI